LKSSLDSQRLVVLLMLTLGIAFFYAAYKAIDNTVAEQSLVQQQAVSPVYSLVNEELLKPLYIAETFASTIDFTVAMDSPDLDETALLNRLQEMQRDLGLVFFVASEKTRRQYLSDGTTLDLVEGEVSWYFDARDSGRDFLADLGQVGDVHLYFDVKVRGRDGEFLGFVGVGKHYQRFIDTFAQYKSLYGYDFLFVNNKDEIILSSLPDLVVTDAYIPTLQSLEWFDHGDSLNLSRDNEIIQVEDEDFLISEFGIEELGWRLLLLVPLEARQAQINRSFLTNALAALVIVALFASLFFYLLLLNKRHLEKKSELDPLTGLPNRIYVQRRYKQLQQSAVQMCAVVIDLDHFKIINDTHGHDAGDQVLKTAADTFTNELREKDIVSRWGGEEFVMLIPASSIELGGAIAERARQSLEALSVETRKSKVTG